jgi:hypothetical protein
MNLRRLLFKAIILSACIPICAPAAQIFITNYPSEANAKVFVTKYQSEANCLVYDTQYKSEADLIVYFTKYKNNARCRY